MALPVAVLPTSSVSVAGESVTFRSLSRTEAMKATTQFKDDPDAAEIFILACGTSVTQEEAAAWRNATNAETVGILVDAIVMLSFGGFINKDDGTGPKG